MQKIEIADLYTLEQYAKVRPDFRSRAIAEKARRKLGLGHHATLFFENRLTMQYQIQEMLRIERIFEEAGIRDELDAYNPLIPDGRNWKATFMLQFEDVAERRARLQQLVGIEERVWVKVGDGERIFAIADEDLERSSDEKTSAVHFLRFELDDEAIAGLRDGADVSVGIDHSAYRVAVEPVPAELKEALVSDIT